VSDLQTATRPVVDGATARAIEMLDRGESAAAAADSLIEMGMSADAAKEIVRSYVHAPAAARMAGIKGQLGYGVLILALGLGFLWAGTHQRAFYAGLGILQIVVAALLRWLKRRAPAGTA
jgi:hypothetical protein